MLFISILECFDCYLIFVLRSHLNPGPGGILIKAGNKTSWSSFQQMSKERERNNLVRSAEDRVTWGGAVRNRNEGRSAGQPGHN